VVRHASGRSREQPQAFAISFDQVRRVMLRRFPYFLLYGVFSTEVVVFGVIHGARDPRIWMTRGDA
jgi:hypothetical protein